MRIISYRSFDPIYGLLEIDALPLWSESRHYLIVHRFRRYFVQYLRETTKLVE